jgi:uncharacterized protein
MKPAKKPGATQKSKTRKSAPATKVPPHTARSQTKAKATPTPSKPEAKTSIAWKRPEPIPPVLLEGDTTSEPQPGGPGMRYALGPQPPAARPGKMPSTGELPEAYGTKRLLLTARDPHWLYAHWDFTAAQLREYNALSADRHLIVRVHRERLEDLPDAEVHVHPESRNWFIHVGVGGARYVAELGYYTDPDRRWIRVATSSPTLTPPDEMSADTSVQFATIPAEISYDELTSIIKTAVSAHVPLAEAILHLRALGVKGLPEPEAFTSARWTPEQERALASVISMDTVRRVWIGSLEITELVRRHLARQVSSAAAAQFGVAAPSSAALGSVTSPFGGIEKKKGFWFNVNAELIIYGATEPDASVAIGGRPIQLRADGSFSYRFALPDGEYQLPATATAADGEDSRTADLRFSRQTVYHGHVTAHPQDATLKTPHPTHVA